MLHHLVIGVIFLVWGIADVLRVQLPGVLAALERRGLLERSALVSNCGLPGEQVYADLSAFPREQDAGYFATIIVKED